LIRHGQPSPDKNQKRDTRKIKRNPNKPNGSKRVKPCINIEWWYGKRKLYLLFNGCGMQLWQSATWWHLFRSKG